MKAWTLFATSLAICLMGAGVSAAPAFIDRSGTSHLVFTSDPQYPWTAFSDNGQDIANSTNERLSRGLIEEQYQDIADFRESRPDLHIPVMINGDMTAFGHGWQRRYLYSTLDRILGGDYYFGLGNHDYQNNVNDCGGNGCARDSLLDLKDRMGDKVDHMDLSIAKVGRNETWDGSLAYSKRLDDVTLIQLNNYPTYEVSFTSTQLLKARTYDFRISDSLDWLELQLKQARDNNQIILLSMHSPWDWEDERNLTHRFRNLIKKYQVTAVFAGHLHNQIGSYSAKHYFADVPLFVSGSSSRETYLVATVNRNAGNLTVSTVERNNWRRKNDIAVIALPQR